MQAKKRKKTATATAGIIALVIALAGTFAWQSISQTALNEKAGEANPGGRLHDDFNGTNKDVYVENFAEEGAEPIFARIRLDEYMEIGADAGTNKDDENRNATPVMEGTDINDETTWLTHVPGDEEDPFHEYWTWTMGGSKIFMPTFNKNKDSLEADINGTFAGPDNDPTTDEDRYKDYQEYTDGKKETANAIYDADDNTFDEGEDAVEGDNIKTVSEEHTAKSTQDAKVLTMDEWKNMGSPLGKYWVYDTDGWAYWAERIEPGEATGLLLNGISMDKTPSNNWYYAINVVGQFVTADDIGNAEDGTGLFSLDAEGAPSDNAMKLLTQAATATLVTGADGNTYMSYGDNTYRMMNADGTVNDKLICGGEDGEPGTADDKTNVVELATANATYGSKFLGPQADGSYLAAGADNMLGTTDDIQVWGNPTLEKEIVDEFPVDNVTVTATGNATSVKAGATLAFNAKVTYKDADSPYQNVTWKVSGNSSDDTKISDAGVLTVASGETASSLTVTATSEQKNTVSGIATVNVMSVTSITVSAADNATTVVQGNTLQYSVTVNGNNLTDSDKGVTWTVSGSNSSGTKIDADGLLTVGTDETPKTITIKATSKYDTSKSGTATVTVQTLKEAINNITPGSTTTVTIDGLEYYVLAKENDQALLLTKGVLSDKQTFGNSYIWRDSTLRTYLNGEWLESMPTLKTAAVQTDITTRSSYNATDWITTQDKVFLLSEADVFGTIQGGKTASDQDYTYGNTPFVPDSIKTIGSSYWLRSPNYSADSVSLFGSSGYRGSDYYTNSSGVRPALWINLAS